MTITYQHSDQSFDYYSFINNNKPVRLRKNRTTKEICIFLNDLAVSMGYVDKDDFILNHTNALEVLMDTFNEMNLSSN